MFTCEQDGQLTEIDWAAIYDLSSKGYTYGTLCKPCADAIVEAQVSGAKHRAQQREEERKERAELNQQNRQREIEREARKAARKGLPVPSEAVLGASSEPRGVKPPKDLRGLKLGIGEVAADFKAGSIRQMSYQQALADTHELTDRQHHDARWLIQRGYLRVVSEDEKGSRPVVKEDTHGPTEVPNVGEQPIIDPQGSNNEEVQS